MKYSKQIAKIRQSICLLTSCLGFTFSNVQAETIVNFPFNEGTGLIVHDTANGLIGSFGMNGVVPDIDTVALTNDSPSGLPGDGSFVNNRSGFLVTDDTTRWLDITNGPITMEAWVKVNPEVRQSNEGIAGYGSSYKLGLRNRVLTFTLFGLADISSPYTNSFPTGEWVHVAAAWTPGVGVNFYITSATLTTNTFRANTARTQARPILNTFLGVGNEGLATALVGQFDRVKIHNKVLEESEIDKDAGTPKANLPETMVAYHFNETAFPSTNSVVGAPELPLQYGNPVLAPIYAPVWTNDTPTGLPDDYALAFNLEAPLNRQRINLEHHIDVGLNNTNYTLEAWVKLPAEPITNRMTILRTTGPGPRVSLSVNTNRDVWTTVFGNADFKSSVIIPDDHQWHHVAVVMEDFAQVKFYLDGELSQTMNRTAAGVPSSAAVTNLLIGMETDALFFKGLLDRVRISNHALSAEELDSIAIPPPTLSFQLEGNNIVLTWPASFEGFTLESAATIDAEIWNAESSSVEGDQNTATISIAAGNRFYRLRK